MKSHAQWQQVDASTVILLGALDCDHVPCLWKFIEQHWQPVQPNMEISLKQVERVDSSGMALLICLIEHAKKQNCHIMLSSVPEQLSTLFQLSNIESLFVEHISTN